MSLGPLLATAAVACASGQVRPSAEGGAIPPRDRAGKAATEVGEKLERLHVLVGRARSEWEKKASHRPWASVPDGTMEVWWFAEFDGTAVPEDDAARGRPKEPSAFLAVVYDRDGVIVATSRRPEAGGQDSHSQDDLLFDGHGRTLGRRHSYLSHVDCGVSRIERVSVTEFDVSGSTVGRTETIDAGGMDMLPPECALADREPEVPRTAGAALRLYGLDERWLRAPRQK